MKRVLWLDDLPGVPGLALTVIRRLQLEAGVSVIGQTSAPPGVNTPRIQVSDLFRPPWTGHRVVVSATGIESSLSLLRSLGLPLARIEVLEADGACRPADREGRVQSPYAGLRKLRDMHVGGRAFVLGNGPSLAVEDLDRLTGEITLASNKIYLAFPDTSWRPTYYTVCDQLVAANNTGDVNGVPATSLFPSTLRVFGCSVGDGLWYEERFENKFLKELSEVDREGAGMYFGRDIEFGVHGGYTVIYHQLQLAYYMGIREVYLLGVDFSFSVPDRKKEDPRFASSVYRDALESEGEVNHFHPDYRKPGEKWSVPRLDLQRHAFREAGRVFNDSGGVLVNASRKTALDVLPKGDLDSIL